MSDVFERLDKKCFRDALARPDDVALLYGHDDSLGVLARNTSGTLRLSVDNLGLAWSTEMPGTSLADDILQSMSRGDLYSCSFAFSIDGPDGEDWYEEGDQVIRLIRSVRLWDCSIVVRPAYPAAACAIDDRVGASGPKVYGGSLNFPRHRPYARVTPQAARNRVASIARQLVNDRCRTVCAGIPLRN